MPNKLTDKEIVKALKELLEIMLCEGDLQRSATISKAFDLINRLQSRVEKCEKVEHFADKTIATLQAENERLEAEVKALIEHSIHERYPHIVLCGNGAIFTKSLEEYDKLIADISAEARKEFAERIKLLSQNSLIIWNEQIDNLLKEMESEDK